jgi:hypothetical protein
MAGCRQGDQCVALMITRDWRALAGDRRKPARCHDLRLREVRRTMTERQAPAFERGVPQARVLRLESPALVKNVQAEVGDVGSDTPIHEHVLGTQDLCLQRPCLPRRIPCVPRAERSRRDDRCQHQVRFADVEWRQPLTNPNRPVLRPAEGSKREDDWNPNQSAPARGLPSLKSDAGIVRNRHIGGPATRKPGTRPRTSEQP